MMFCNTEIYNETMESTFCKFRSVTYHFIIYVKPDTPHRGTNPVKTCVLNYSTTLNHVSWRGVV